MSEDANFSTAYPRLVSELLRDAAFADGER
jgi:hypothetical protein